LLRSVDVGRLGVTVDGEPDIFPVNFVVDHGTIVFRTAAGTKSAAALSALAVAFEADGYDSDTQQAWSVVVKGQAREISEPADVAEAFTLPLSPWHAESKGHLVRVVPRDVSGRQFAIAAPSRWATPLSGARRSATE
jgi:nitroimidazol reductase NimA-like FMN-containing flavoprotein (pyridoxamine 5'-phosphate oxidase superfamily)